jgi:4a-hydroxytetrahydrobiopterin dehydratase
METLAEMKCEVCRLGAPQVTDEEIAEYHPLVPKWKLVEHNGIRQLERLFQFPGFVQALAFTNRVGEIAEVDGHHPSLLTEWGRVTVTWWTIKINGLHRNDFIMAVKTDKLYPE